MSQRVLGVDPGTTHMGYGLVEALDGEIRYLTSGVLIVSRSRPMGERLWHLHGQLLRIVETWSPSAVAIEEPFVSVAGMEWDSSKASARSSIAIGQAQAVALMVAAANGITAFRYPPAQVKHAVTEYGRGSKAQVAEMVRLLLGMERPPQPADAADALAVALCHLHQERIRALA